MATKVASLYAELNADTSQLEGRLSEVEGRLKKTDAGLTGVKGNFKSLVVPVAAASAAIAGAGMAMKQLYAEAQQGAQIERLATSFKSIAGAANESSSGIIDAIREASNYTISREDAMMAANAALQLGVARTPDEFRKLTAASLALGRGVGESATQSLLDLSRGIGKVSPQILDNLNVVGASTNAYPQYAASIGKSVDALTDAEKKTALLNYALHGAKPLLDEQGKLVDDNASAFERFGAAAADSGARFKTGVADIVSPFVGRLADLLVYTNQVADAQDRFGAVALKGQGNIYKLADGTRVTGDQLARMAQNEKEAARAASDADIKFRNMGTGAETAGTNIVDLTRSQYLEQAAEAIIAHDYAAAKHFIELADQAGFAESQINAVKSALERVNGTTADAFLNYHVTTSGSRDVATGLASSSSDSGDWVTKTDALGRKYRVNTKTGAMEKLYASGGDFVVPSGYPNDSFHMAVSSGERVSVTPAGEPQAAQGITLNGPFIFQNQIDLQQFENTLLAVARSR